MGAQVFEVGLFKPSAQEQGQAVMIPRTWDRDTVLRSIPWLRLQNADGRNIYIRPKGEHDLSLVDDLTGGCREADEGGRDFRQPFLWRRLQATFRRGSNILDNFLVS